MRIYSNKNDFFSLKRFLNNPLASHSGWMAAGSIIQSVVAFVANLVLIRYIEPDSFGRYAVSLASISLIISIMSLKVGTQIIRIGEYEFDDNKQRFFFNVIIHELLIGGAIAFCVLYFSNLLNVWSVILLTSVQISQFADTSKVIYERKMLYKKISFLETGVNLSGHVISVTIVVLGGHAAALYIRELSYGIFTLFLLKRINGLKWYRLRLLNLYEWKQIFLNIRGIWFDSMLEGSFLRIIMILANHIGGNKGAGYFFQAYRLANVPHQFLAPLAGRISLNWFARQEDCLRKYNGFRKLVFYMSGILFIIGTLTVLFSEKLVLFLFGTKWANTAEILVKLTGVVIFLSLFELQKSFLIACYQTKNLIVMRIAQYAGLLFVIVLFSRNFNVGDIGFGVSIAYALSFVIGFWLIRKYAKNNIL